MVVFKKKSRMVSIRLSEDEYSILQDATQSNGARSVSDFARDVLFRSSHPALRGSGGERVLQAKVDRLYGELQGLTEQVERLRRAVGDTHA